jgi:hypothetical protein
MAARYSSFLKHVWPLDAAVIETSSGQRIVLVASWPSQSRSSCSCRVRRVACVPLSSSLPGRVNRGRLAAAGFVSRPAHCPRRLPLMARPLGAFDDHLRLVLDPSWRSCGTPPPLPVLPLARGGSKLPLPGRGLCKLMFHKHLAR